MTYEEKDFRVGFRPENPDEEHKYIVMEKDDEFIYHALNYDYESCRQIKLHADIDSILKKSSYPDSGYRSEWDTIGGGHAQLEDGELEIWGESGDFGPESVTDDQEVQEKIEEAYKEGPSEEELQSLQSLKNPGY